jgi:pilus assembly protein Flp/PilA
MFKHFIATLKDEKGQALTEYGLIIALIAVICVAALTAMGQGVLGTLTTITASL